MANYQELKERTLGSIQEEEAVTVNTRALVCAFLLLPLTPIADKGGFGR
jgi:hypothetical protein